MDNTRHRVVSKVVRCSAISLVICVAIAVKNELVDSENLQHNSISSAIKSDYISKNNIVSIQAAVKYANTTEEKANGVAQWLANRSAHDKHAQDNYRNLDWITQSVRSGCGPYCRAFVSLSPLVGLQARPAYTFWPTIGNDHWWVQIWDTECNKWHDFDISAINRPYQFPWLHRIPKAVVYIPKGLDTDYNAIQEKRWEDLTNVIADCYPSGKVNIEILQQGRPVAKERVEVFVWLGNGMGGRSANAVKFDQPTIFSIGAALSDSNGIASLVLGHSAQQPYRIALCRTEKSDWTWLAVQSNKLHKVTLHIESVRPFNINEQPPKLPWFEDEQDM